jgi:hypothetical protein
MGGNMISLKIGQLAVVLAKIWAGNGVIDVTAWSKWVWLQRRIPHLHLCFRKSER